MSAGWGDGENGRVSGEKSNEEARNIVIIILHVLYTKVARHAVKARYIRARLS